MEAERGARWVEPDMDRDLCHDPAPAQKTSPAEGCDRYQRETFPLLETSGRGERARVERLASRLGAYSLATLEPYHVAE